MATKVLDSKGTEWTRESIIALLQGCGCGQCKAWEANPRDNKPCRRGTLSNAAVESALLRLYERQTRGEQDSELTREVNQRGFGQSTAEIFTSFAKQIQTNKFKNPVGLRLTPKQFARCRKPWGQTTIPTIGTYANQLLEEVESKAEKTTLKPTLTVTSLRGERGFPYRWQVIGKPDEVAEWFAELCKQYPTNPYGTTSMSRRLDDNGTMTAIFGHYGTCD